MAGYSDGIRVDPIFLASQLVNEVMNFPSLEGADDAQPEWWEEADANATLTEVDVGGESITENYERAHKVVVATANSYAYQRFTYADQPRVKSGRKISALFATWSVSAVSAFIRFRDSAGTTWTSPTTTAAGWTLLSVTADNPAGTYIQIEEAVNIGTAYFVPLGLMIGSRAVSLPRRPLQYRFKSAPAQLVDLATLGDPNTWTDVDCTTASSPLACVAEIQGQILGVNASSWAIGIRRNGDSTALGGINQFFGTVSNTVVRPTGYARVILDDSQIFEYIADRYSGTGTIGEGAINLWAWQEWG